MSFTASWFIRNISFETGFLKVHVRLLTCWFNEMVQCVNRPSDCVTLGVAVLIFVPSLWVHGFVHLIKEIQLFCHFVDTFFVWPGILFAVTTPQLDLNVEQTSANLNQLLRLPATNQCDLYPWVHLATLKARHYVYSITISSIHQKSQASQMRQEETQTWDIFWFLNFYMLLFLSTTTIHVCK